MGQWWDTILVLPEDMIAFAWSAPMRDLAPQVGLSDVGLRKKLNGSGVPLPPQGYWNKVHAGKPLPPTPLPEPRRPGQVGRLKVDKQFRKVIPLAGHLPSTGPFASSETPESLEELYSQELKAIGHVAVPKTLDRPHPALLDLLRKEEKRRAKFSERGWSTDAPLFDSPVAKRQLRILNALCRALTKRQHEGHVFEQDGFIRGSAVIGDTRVGINLAVIGKDPRRQNWQPLAVGMPLSTPLTLSLSRGFEGSAAKTWQDDKGGNLEDKLATIAASIIVEGEASFRRSLREAEEREEKEHLEAERRRLEHLKALNQQRLKDLATSGELLRQAEDIRALINRVRSAMINGTADVDSATLEAWEKWASEQADQIDPILSGQYISHLRAPKL
ncbi:hypothetical protein DTW90_11990 [Neorhizobium sp. P12A]|uniref:hypothetical protein n=1 Tax=Neorhizobium sp. P12A TaxID=2268027 RepID=UPI0011EFBAE6|nr:hypothetical protein [Neorhizobium sp. P12A]KAA0698521.1 hypothetical protein DTW90_11990 [Neorhizobium sp. P12A]